MFVSVYYIKTLYNETVVCCLIHNYLKIIRTYNYYNNAIGMTNLYYY